MHMFYLKVFCETSEHPNKKRIRNPKNTYYSDYFTQSLNPNIQKDKPKTYNFSIFL